MFNPSKLPTLGLILAISLLLVTVGVMAQNNNDDSIFADVPQDHWAYDDIQYLAQRGIIRGLPSGEYQGEEAMTRYSVASIVARALRYMQENQQSISQKDLSTLEDLTFKLSDQVKAMDQDFSNLKSRVSELQSRVNQMEAAGPPEDYQKLQQKANQSFVLGVAGVAVGVASLAYSLLFLGGQE